MNIFINHKQASSMICQQQERLYSAMDGHLDEDIFRRSFRCSLVPIAQGQMEIHLLFLQYAQVPDELPDIKRMKFSVLDLSWIASQNIRKRIVIDDPDKRSEEDIVSYQTIIKRDPIAKEKFKKWSDSIQKEIQEIVGKCLWTDEEQAAVAMTTKRFWRQIVKNTGLHDAYIAQDVVAQNLIVDWQGRIASKGATRHPLGWDLRKLCQEFSRYLVFPQLQAQFMWQIIPKEERRDQKHGATAPWHIGWYDLNGIPVMSGIRSVQGQPFSYGSALLRNLPQKSKRLEELLAVAPYEITVPLLCYGIFSVIKPFLPDYPAIISVNDSFSSVIKRQKDMIFLSLTGPNSKALAGLFFGAFVDYGEVERQDAREAKKRLRQLQSRVHDGIVILNEEFKNLQAFRNRAMLRDACIVLTNSSFEENDFEIRLSSDQFDPQLSSQAMQQVFPNVLIEFLDWFRVEYIWQQEEWVREALSSITDRANELYQRWHQFLTREKSTNIPKKLLRISENPVGNWSELNDVVKAYTVHLEEIIEKDTGDQLYYARKKEAALGWIANFSKQANQIAKDYQLKADASFVNEFFNLSRIRKQCPQPWGNLEIALYVFRKFMETHSEYSQISLPKPWEDYLGPAPKTSEQTYEKLFFRYLSQQLELGYIIPFRAKRTSGCLGWYDGAKDLFYLLYSSYYSDFRNWLTGQGQIDLPSQRIFQQKLADEGLLLLADNHSKSGYLRPDYRIIVDPLSDTEPQAKVIKVKPDITQLSAKAQTVMRQLAEQKVPRRRASSKEV